MPNYPPQGNLAPTIVIGEIDDATLVIESEGIASNDNDTTFATSAAVKDYSDTTSISNVLTDGQILVGNGSNVATDVAVTGDITISNAGVVAIAANVIIDGDLSAGAFPNITGVGTIATGTWQGTVVANAFLDVDTAHLAVAQTFTANKNFNGANLIIEDSDILFFGDASDSSIRYDGTNLIIDPQDVGTGHTLFKSDLEVDGGLKMTTLNKQFEDYFSGDSLSTAWTFVENNGSTGVMAMLDGIGEGLRITTGATGGNRAVIWFNDIKHFDAALCTIYGVFKYDNTDNVTQMGICDAVDIELAATELITCVLTTGSTFVALRSSDGSVTDTASDVALSANRVTFKIINNATNMRLFILESGAWVLKVTKTSNKPASQAMSPVFGVRNISATADTGDAIYMKVQND